MLLMQETISSEVLQRIVVNFYWFEFKDHMIHTFPVTYTNGNFPLKKSSVQETTGGRGIL